MSGGSGPTPTRCIAPAGTRVSEQNPGCPRCAVPSAALPARTHPVPPSPAGPCPWSRPSLRAALVEARVKDRGNRPVSSAPIPDPGPHTHLPPSPRPAPAVQVSPKPSNLDNPAPLISITPPTSREDGGKSRAAERGKGLEVGCAVARGSVWVVWGVTQGCGSLEQRFGVLGVHGIGF